MSDELSAEDAKLITLARGARARIGAATGAAVRDETGRTYAAADANMPSVLLTAVQLAVAQAWISGASGLEAVVIVTGDPETDHDLSAVVDLGGDAVPVLICGPDGMLLRVVASGPGA